MNTQKLGIILLSLPRDILHQILSIIATHLYGPRQAAFLKEAALHGYQIAGHEAAQTALVVAHGVAAQKMRNAADRRRLRLEDEMRRRQEENERQKRLEAFWNTHHSDHGPGGTTNGTGSGPSRQGNSPGNDKAVRPDGSAGKE